MEEMNESESDVLYHYCTSETFVSIIQHKSLRLSSMSLSNDSQEGRLAHKLLLAIGKEIGLSTEALSGLDGLLDSLNQSFDGLAFCLSEKGDRLSQWRGYAADGSGVCIGFRKAALEAMGAGKDDAPGQGFRLRQVEYSLDRQKDILRPALLAFEPLLRHRSGDEVLLTLPPEMEQLVKTIDPDWERLPEGIAKVTKAYVVAFAREVGRHIYALKTSAFAEEFEWRLLSLRVKGASPNIQFRPAGARIIPFRAYKFIEPKETIARVILGPKHESPTSVIEEMLTEFDFGKVKVEQSKASYR